MQSQIYRILADRSGKPLRQIIRDTKRTDFYLDAFKAHEYGLIDNVLRPVKTTQPKPIKSSNTGSVDTPDAIKAPDIAASERSTDDPNASRN